MCIPVNRCSLLYCSKNNALYRDTVSFRIMAEIFQAAYGIRMPLGSFEYLKNSAYIAVKFLKHVIDTWDCCKPKFPLLFIHCLLCSLISLGSKTQIDLFNVLAVTQKPKALGFRSEILQGDAERQTKNYPQTGPQTLPAKNIYTWYLGELRGKKRK